MLATIGLSLITLAWLVQLYFSYKKPLQITKSFIILYMLGVAFLVANGAITNSLSSSWSELLTFVAAGLVLVKIYTIKKPAKNGIKTKRI